MFLTYLFCELIAHAIVSLTIDTSIWIPFRTALIVLLLCVFVLAVMPETMSSVDHGPSEQSQPKSTRRPLLAVLRSRNMLLAFTILLLSALRPATLAILVQYVTLRFEWKYAQAAVLVEEVAIVNIVLFRVILPQIVPQILAARQIRTKAKDWAVVYLSLILLSLEAFLIGWSPSPRALVPGKSALVHLYRFCPLKNWNWSATSVFALGYGTRVATLFLAIIWTSEDTQARVFGVIQIVEKIEKLGAKQLLLRVLGASLGKQEFWLGLPFFVASVSLAMIPMVV